MTKSNKLFGQIEYEKYLEEKLDNDRTKYFITILDWKSHKKEDVEYVTLCYNDKTEAFEDYKFYKDSTLNISVELYEAEQLR